jgi:phosphatidylserine/phosphatidylglycerophosphate/cardiolipin synthase-like enzyme
MPSSRRQPYTSRGTRSLNVQQALILIAFFAAFFIYRAWQEKQQINNGATSTSSPMDIVTQNQGEPTKEPPAATPYHPPGDPVASVAEGEQIRVFFSNPLNNVTTGGPENQLKAAIDNAQSTIDMAIYNISLENVVNALISAHQRGVKVRLVMESEAMDKKQPARLRASGIPIIGDQREGLMHNKFTVIDRKEVWTGSMNYTSTSAYMDFNNLVRLTSPEAAQDYTVEFEEMFTDNLFGPDTRTATPYPSVNIGGSIVNIYFSPDDGVAEKIVSSIRGAKESVDFLAYSFTSNEISAALLERARAGVAIRGVFDESQVETNTGGEYSPLKKAGINVHLDGIPGLMHSKVFIIDHKIIITGSYNFSSSAEHVNDENLIIIHDPKVASAFTANFETVFSTSH